MGYVPPRPTGEDLEKRYAQYLLKCSASASETTPPRRGSGRRRTPGFRRRDQALRRPGNLRRAGRGLQVDRGHGPVEGDARRVPRRGRPRARPRPGPGRAGPVFHGKRREWPTRPSPTPRPPPRPGPHGPSSTPAECYERMEDWEHAELWNRRNSERYPDQQVTWFYYCVRTGRGDRSCQPRASMGPVSSERGWERRHVEPALAYRAMLCPHEAPPQTGAQEVLSEAPGDAR